MTLQLVLRWTARIWGIASTLLLGAFVFGGREHLRFSLNEAVAFLFFPVGVVVGFVIAWYRELAGGLVTVGSLVLFHLYLRILTYGMSGGAPTGPYFLLLAAPGFLHLASAFLRARKPGRPNRPT